MINELKTEANTRMTKAIEALGNAFNKIRTGRAHPSLLDGITVDYYGVSTPLAQAHRFLSKMPEHSLSPLGKRVWCPRLRRRF